MSHPIKTKLTLLVVGLACLGLGVVFASGLDWTPASMATQDGQANSAVVSHSSAGELSGAYEQIAQNVTPTVVSIIGTRVVSRQRLDLGPFEDNAPFDQFFRFHHDPSTPDEPDQDQGGGREAQRGAGSGVIVRPDGYILTNNHVVDGMDDLRVVMNDRRTFEAKVVGRDPSTDLAVLKIDAENLPVARMANDDHVQVGEWVAALGNPFGLQFTMTAGIVSAIGRGNLQIIDRGQNPYAIEDFIQTDAAINPGNSGGPLVNLDGDVIGINTAIASRTGGYQGYGFAIPISIVRHVMDELIENGKVERAILGVAIQPVSALDKEALGLPDVEGVFISDFSDMPDNPARKAGLQPKDVVLAVNGKKVDTPSELQQAIAFHKPGDKVTLKVWRAGDTRDVEVRLGEAPSPQAGDLASQGDKEVHESSLGMDVRDVTSQARQFLAQRMDVDPASIPDGVLVQAVEPLSAADEAGIPQSSIITQVGETRVHDVQQFRDAVSKLKGGSVVYLRVFFAGNQLYRPIRVPKK